ncbi:translation elongation factor P [Streptococcus mitis SK321]|nr:translation elongation factor P [Streptococcus mitis SK321]
MSSFDEVWNVDNKSSFHSCWFTRTCNSSTFDRWLCFSDCQFNSSWYSYTDYFSSVELDFHIRVFKDVKQFIFNIYDWDFVLVVSFSVHEVGSFIHFVQVLSWNSLDNSLFEFFFWTVACIKCRTSTDITQFHTHDRVPFTWFVVASFQNADQFSVCSFKCHTSFQFACFNHVFTSLINIITLHFTIKSSGNKAKIVIGRW